MFHCTDQWLASADHTTVFFLLQESHKPSNLCKLQKCRWVKYSYSFLRFCIDILAGRPAKGTTSKPEEGVLRVCCTPIRWNNTDMQVLPTTGVARRRFMWRVMVALQSSRPTLAVTRSAARAHSLCAQGKTPARAVRNSSLVPASSSS
jgi:hypothetical protein